MIQPHEKMQTDDGNDMIGNAPFEKYQIESVLRIIKIIKNDILVYLRE